MKIFLITICSFSILITGCTVGWPFHTAAYYQPNKTLEQAITDCNECKKEAAKWNSAIAFQNCMERKGYKIYSMGRLRDWEKEGKVNIREDFWTSKDVAGDVLE